jgi:hypothetical protein
MNEERSSMTEILMLLVCLAPVTGAMFSGPMVGLTLVTLGITDSILILGGWGR